MTAKDLTLEEAATLMGVHRTTAFRRLRFHLKWAMHNGRRVRKVSLPAVRAAALPHLAEAESRALSRRIDALEKRLAESEAGGARRS